jgi:hypothetical protein
MKNSFRFFILTGMALFLNAGFSSAVVYKQVDANGNITYSDKPPIESSSKSKVSEVRTTPSADPQALDRLRKGQADLQKQKAERAENEKKAQEAKKEEGKRAQFCRDAKMALNQYKSRAQLYRAGESGERVYLSQQDKDSEITRLESEMKAAKCE